MTIKELLIEADAIQVGVTESDWQKVIHLAASPLVTKGYISAEYGQAVIDNTLHHGAYYVFDEGVAIPHARPECGVKRNCFSLVVLNKPIQFADSEKADIVIMFGAQASLNLRFHNWKRGMATPAWRHYGRCVSRSTFPLPGCWSRRYKKRR